MATKKSTQSSSKKSPTRSSASSSRGSNGRKSENTRKTKDAVQKVVRKTVSSAPKPSTPVKKINAPAEKDSGSQKKLDTGLSFIGNFPIRKKDDEKKNDLKKQSVGPVFVRGDYKIITRNSPLAKALVEEFQKVYLTRHTNDTFVAIKTVPESNPLSELKQEYARQSLESLLRREADIAVHNMKDIPLEIPEGLVVAAALKREDARDAMVTKSTFGAIQELPTKAKVGATSKRKLMQLRHLRPDLEIVPLSGDLIERLQKLDSLDLDAVLVSWAGLKRLNISPRYYVALQTEMMLPSPCQGIVGVVCREEDQDLVQKLHYIEDSEASWAARCERAFLQKLGGLNDSPVGAHAHRKGTQDPWIIDAVIGDEKGGDVLKHREIGTSRCKPESLADKAFTGILAKGARKFLPI